MNVNKPLNQLGFGNELSSILSSSEWALEQIGIIVVDHGSRREESNQLLLVVADHLRVETGLERIEPAHMELAEPSIKTAYDRVVARGAKLVIVHPYFLSPGRHWHQDIPRLAAEAARPYPETRFVVTAPLGIHGLMLQIIQDRIQQCLRRAVFDSETCDVCRDTAGCQILPAAPLSDGPSPE
ncbi:MAG: CbiX/SirB N-terminal domain-containing protein [Pirellulaceae bacterium]|nr:CbiX/SirB N-terminal domain-containing protein [Pirellulaceae bacterium]